MTFKGPSSPVFHYTEYWKVLQVKISARPYFPMCRISYQKLTVESSFRQIQPSATSGHAPKVPDPVKQEYLSAYISPGVKAMIRTWVARDFTESVDEIVAMAVQSQGVLSHLP